MSHFFLAHLPDFKKLPVDTSACPPIPDYKNDDNTTEIRHSLTYASKTSANFWIGQNPRTFRSARRIREATPWSFPDRLGYQARRDPLHPHLGLDERPCGIDKPSTANENNGTRTYTMNTVRKQQDIARVVFASQCRYITKTAVWSDVNREATSVYHSR